MTQGVDIWFSEELGIKHATPPRKYPRMGIANDINGIPFIHNSHIFREHERYGAIGRLNQKFMTEAEQFIRN